MGSALLWAIATLKKRLLASLVIHPSMRHLEISFCNVVDEILISAGNLKSFVFFGHEGGVRKKKNIYKSQVQGISLSIWGVVHKELGFNY